MPPLSARTDRDTCSVFDRIGLNRLDDRTIWHGRPFHRFRTTTVWPITPTVRTIAPNRLYNRMDDRNRSHGRCAPHVLRLINRSATNRPN
ncbi:unnamed protein product [Microthlaspi erraticum]|uniref:Uncharacterized protein n=1 Tax=Microthlaspi erraticum TaxID=1685480 RepID=A0A6D2KEM9_9BRAS|nr:unnamed protein product [Microthlaspi erraticum]